jgi:3',5'-cyclic AMP phosphodiesterase CpdA
MLELRIRYQDGLVAWMNGHEVARRALPVAPSAAALAARAHGPEWETLYIPVAPGMLRLGANTLALEVHPSAKHPVATVRAVLAGRRRLGIVRGPLLQRVGPGEATIVVETDPDVDVELTWGADPTMPTHVHSPPGRRHELVLRGLPARATIHYAVHAGASVTSTHQFHTAPAVGEVIRIGVYGDVRGGHEVHRRLVDAMAGEALDLVVVTGDMVRRGSDEADWQRFFAVTADLMARVPYYPAIGNHDVGRAGDLGRRAEDIFALPPPPADRPEGVGWYALDVADLHLVFLDSNAYERVAQERWLDADLAAARRRGVRAIVAVTHDGPYSRGTHRGNKLARERYVPILARHHVELLLAGHDHLYERGAAGGVAYLVSGGGGASLYDVSCGTAAKPACAVDDGLVVVRKEHHYLILTISDHAIEACPRRADGSTLEPCVRYPRWRPAT